jgi:hypothetical protein
MCSCGKELRLLKNMTMGLAIWSALTTMLGIALWASRPTVVRADSAPDVITAKRFVLTDSAGNQLATLGTYVDQASGGKPTVVQFKMSSVDGYASANLTATPRHGTPGFPPMDGDVQFMLTVKGKGTYSADENSQAYMHLSGLSGDIGTMTQYTPGPLQLLERSNMVTSPGNVGQINCKNANQIGGCSPAHY